MLVYLSNVFPMLSATLKTIRKRRNFIIYAFGKINQKLSREKSPESFFGVKDNFSNMSFNIKKTGWHETN